MRYVLVCFPPPQVSLHVPQFPHDPSQSRSVPDVGGVVDPPVVAGGVVDPPVVAGGIVDPPVVAGGVVDPPVVDPPVVAGDALRLDNGHDFKQKSVVPRAWHPPFIPGRSAHGTPHPDSTSVTVVVPGCGVVDEGGGGGGVVAAGTISYSLNESTLYPFLSLPSE
jgi:hypothetical protein